MNWKHYENAGEPFGLTSRKIASLVNKHKLKKRKIYGKMAVESEGFENLMRENGFKLLPNYVDSKKTI